MQTTPESDALFAELLARAEILVELDGPQIEAWVSGLFTALDDTDTLLGFVDYCGAHESVVATLVCAAIAELTAGLEPVVSGRAHEHAAHVGADDAPAAVVQIGTSELTRAWTVHALFGHSIVLGFENTTATNGAATNGEAVGEADTELLGDDDPVDLRHSILAEIGEDGTVMDLQLAGPPQLLLDEAAAADIRVEVTEVSLADALAQIQAAWPVDGVISNDLGPGVVANQQFVRRRVVAASGEVLALLRAPEQGVDIRRGLDHAEYAHANQAALSTLRAAVGDHDTATNPSAILAAWVGAIRGDGGELSGRERGGLLWLEWADWLGVGIGLLRGGVGTEMTGASFVDLVNRCPEVSSTIDKRDRAYAEWAFAIAIDVLSDAGAADDGQLTQAGFEALHPALVTAWGSAE